MSKIKEAVVEEVGKEVKNNGVAEPLIKAKEAIETLKLQLEERLKQAEYHRTKATKAQGALEVLLHLLPEEDKNEG